MSISTILIKHNILPKPLAAFAINVGNWIFHQKIINWYNALIYDIIVAYRFHVTCLISLIQENTWACEKCCWPQSFYNVVVVFVVVVCNSFLPGKERTKAQRGKCPWLFNDRNSTWPHYKTISVAKPKPVLSGAANIKTGNNHPQILTQNRLPKYGSQSETMTNTCLWLRTISGQT